MKSYIYTFVREDISPEQQIVQIGHACYEAGKHFRDIYGISNLVLLSAKDEFDLKSISLRLEERGLNYYMFHEPDNDMGFSALCTEPIVCDKQRAFFKRWSLFKAT